MKTCKRCGVEKEESEFYLRKDTGKLRPQCKKCFAISQAGSKIVLREKYILLNCEKNEEQKIEAKRCPGCGQIKNSTEFYRCSSVKSGLSSWCKKCKKGEVATPKPGHKFCSICKEEKSFDAFSKSETGKYGVNSRCKQCACIYAENYRNKNSESIREKQFYYRKNNQEVLKKRRRETHQRAKQVPCKKLNINIKALFLFHFKRCNIEKKMSIFSYTGIPMEDYVNHLKKDPLWNDYKNKNYPIHIDHIIPSSLFDLTNPEEIKKCWHPHNLRFLPAFENLSKGGRLDMNLVFLYKIDKLLPSNIKNV